MPENINSISADVGEQLMSTTGCNLTGDFVGDIISQDINVIFLVY